MNIILNDLFKSAQAILRGFEAYKGVSLIRVSFLSNYQFPHLYDSGKASTLWELKKKINVKCIHSVWCIVNSHFVIFISSIFKMSYIEHIFCVMHYNQYLFFGTIIFYPHKSLKNGFYQIGLFLMME